MTRHAYVLPTRWNDADRSILEIDLCDDDIPWARKIEFHAVFATAVKLACINGTIKVDGDWFQLREGKLGAINLLFPETKNRTYRSHLLFRPVPSDRLKAGRIPTLEVPEANGERAREA